MATTTTPDPSFTPGTIHLVDLEGTMHARHAAGGQKDVVLVPTPSSDPDDPLNWSPRRKLLFSFCLQTYTLVVGIASAAIYSILVPISEATGGTLTVGTLNEGTGYMFLAFGWGCLFWQPVAQRIGKRPVYLFSLITTMVSVRLVAKRIHPNRNVGNHALGSIHHDELSVDREQGLTRILRCTHRITV